MDALAFRLANRIVGNREGHAALELTGTGPTLKFGVEATIALAGAHMTATIDGRPVPYWKPVRVPPVFRNALEPDNHKDDARNQEDAEAQHELAMPFQESERFHVHLTSHERVR